ncbi:MAG TPA: hypothetical protein VF322_13480 [Gammaproteobacteria bacterium]
MHSVYFDAAISDDARRSSIYQGQLYVYSSRRSVLEFVRFARHMIEDAFRGMDPEKAQYEMPVERYAEILTKLKPAFIHHPESKRHVQALLTDFGCDPELTYFEVPKMRSSTSDGYLTAGIAYAWHPHRDTWYSAAPCQINWWFPIYELESTNAMAFHPQYWSRPVKNSSAGYNYYEWNKKYRGSHIKSFTNKDPRPLPAPTEPVEKDPQIRILCPVGGILLFSAAHLHSSVPNTSGKTRFSVDFRTVHAGDLAAGSGAPNVDSACTGTALREFKSVASLADLPPEVLAKYEDGTEVEDALVYQPS